MKTSELIIEHANAKGTGSAVRLSLVPACYNGDDTVPGKLNIRLLAQLTLPDAANHKPATFGDEVAVHLEIMEVSQLLQVLRGWRESICEDKGLFHRNASGNTVIRFGHQIEPRPGYRLSVWRKPTDGGEAVEREILFTMDEALVLMLTLERALLPMAFGLVDAPAEREVW